MDNPNMQPAAQETIVHQLDKAAGESAEMPPTCTPLEDLQVDWQKRDTVWTPLPGTPIAECPTSIDLTTMAGRAKALNACSPADTKMPKDGILHLNVCDFIIYPEQVASRETGELVDVIRTVLIDDKGNTYKTTAPHAVEFVRRTLTMFGVAVLKQGIPIIIRRRRGDSDRDYHDLRVNTEAMKS